MQLGLCVQTVSALPASCYLVWHEATSQQSGARVTTAALRIKRSARVWAWAQVVGVVATVALLVGLVAWPAPTLVILWSIVVPILPATFLVNPRIWRNVCPLATLNKLSGDRIGTRRLTAPALKWSRAVGIVLLFALVPARRFAFNFDGLILALVIAAVAALALASGLLFFGKAGFCNSLCPVLPVERLYGQRPLIRVDNARCSPCNRCTRKGCIDLSLDRSIQKNLGHSREGLRLPPTPFGLFAAAFPGFVVGYFSTIDGTLSDAPIVYTRIFVYALVSLLIFGTVALLRVLSTAQLFVLIAATALALYYWHASPGFAEALSLPREATTMLRMASFGLVAAWLLRALPQVKKSRSTADPH